VNIAKFTNRERGFWKLAKGQSCISLQRPHILWKQVLLRKRRTTKLKRKTDHQILIATTRVLLRHNNTSAGEGLKSQDGSLPLPHRPRPSDRSDDMDDDRPSILGGLSHDQHDHAHHIDHLHRLHHHHQQHWQQQGADKGSAYEPKYGFPTTSRWGVVDLFPRGASGVGSGGSDTLPRRDRTKEEFTTIRELERSQKEARFYRKELEQSNTYLQRATSENRRLQTANARLRVSSDTIIRTYYDYDGNPYYSHRSKCRSPVTGRMVARRVHPHSDVGHLLAATFDASSSSTTASSHIPG